MELLSQLTQLEFYIQLLSLVVLLITMEIDNMVFITLLLQKLPESKQTFFRWWVLIGAFLMRILFILGANKLVSLDHRLFSISTIHFTSKHLFLLGGGLFLIISAVKEIHEKLEGPPKNVERFKTHSPSRILLHIFLVNLVFSLDSVITAVGIVQSSLVMVLSIFLALLVTFALMDQIGYFVKKHPTFKILAFAFLLLIGVLLVTEAFHHPIPKGYIYFAMFFSGIVEFINIRVREKWEPVQSQRIKDEN
jgi:predicted tellurium resistance membrane protein TerC